MLVSKISPLTGKMNHMYIDVSDEQFKRWESGELIQQVMPHLTEDEREFLISGCYPGEYENTMDGAYGNEEEDPDELPF